MSSISSSRPLLSQRVEHPVEVGHRELDAVVLARSSGSTTAFVLPSVVGDDPFPDRPSIAAPGAGLHHPTT
jgi:hypothetical protein